jgi:hypothetical protein
VGKLGDLVAAVVIAHPDDPAGHGGFDFDAEGQVIHVDGWGCHGCSFVYVVTNIITSSIHYIIILSCP